MAFVLNDRVRSVTTTTGTGTITLGSTPTGYVGFSTVGNGNTTYYTIVDTATGDWETGVGTYTSSGTTLARSVVRSSNANALVSFGAGSKDVFSTIPAAMFAYGASTAGRVTFYGSNNSFSEDSTLLWDSTNNRLSVGTTVATAGLNVGSTANTTVAELIKGVASQSANLTEWQNSGGTLQLAVTAAGAITGALRFFPDSDGTSALRFFKADNSTEGFRWDSTNNRFAIGNIAGASGFTGSKVFAVAGSGENLAFLFENAATSARCVIGNATKPATTSNSVTLEAYGWNGSSNQTQMGQLKWGWHDVADGGEDTTLGITLYDGGTSSEPYKFSGSRGLYIGKVPTAVSAKFTLCLGHTASIATVLAAAAADCVSMGGKDTVAGQTDLYVANENNKYERLTGLIVRNTSQFDKTSNTTLSTVTGMTHSFDTTGLSYEFRATLFFGSNVAGGVKCQINGTNIAAIRYTMQIFDVAANGLPVMATALATSTGVTAVTSGRIEIVGWAQTTGASTATLLCQFAQNASSGSASSVLVGSTFSIRACGD